MRGFGHLVTILDQLFPNHDLLVLWSLNDTSSYHNSLYKYLSIQLLESYHFSRQDIQSN